MGAWDPHPHLGKAGLQLMRTLIRAICKEKILAPARAQFGNKVLRASDGVSSAVQNSIDIANDRKAHDDEDLGF
jgi:hypothetical protein